MPARKTQSEASGGPPGGAGAEARGGGIPQLDPRRAWIRARISAASEALPLSGATRITLE